MILRQQTREDDVETRPTLWVTGLKGKAVVINGWWGRSEVTVMAAELKDEKREKLILSRFYLSVWHSILRAALWSPVICVFTPPQDSPKTETLTQSGKWQRSAANAAQPGLIEWSRSALFVRHNAAMYEDWYTSAPLSLPDRQTDWYYTPAEDKDKVSVIMLSAGACRRREIIRRQWLWEHFADCHENLSGSRSARWHSAADG